MAGQSVTFSEIEKMLDHFPAQPHRGCGGCEHNQTPIKAAVDHIEAWQVNEENQIRLNRPRVCFFAASHGFDEKSVDELKQSLQETAAGTSILNQLCRLADAELRVYELDIENPTADITADAAMSEEEAARAITYGMMAVEPGLDLLIIDSLSESANFSAQVIQVVLSDATVTDEHINKIIKTQNLQSIPLPLEVLRRVGGYDFCAMLGAAIAARMAGIPIFIDSHAGMAIKTILDTMSPQAGDHLYYVGDASFAADRYRAVASLPSIKAHLILNQGVCVSQDSCATRRAG